MIHPRWMLGRTWSRNPYTPNKLAQRVAHKYARAVGFPPVQPTPYVPVNEAVAREIAYYYDRTPDQSRDPYVRRAYNALVREVAAQFRLVKRIIKLTPHGDGFQPYADSSQMMDDILRNRHLWVYTGGETHKLLNRKQNWMFRAIHDFFGHAAQGLSFGPRGEENAWIEHSKLFSPMARLALTTETRGQNSWVNYGPYSNRPPAERPYAKQKAMILPGPLTIHPVFAAAYRRWPWFV